MVETQLRDIPDVCVLCEKKALDYSVLFDWATWQEQLFPSGWSQAAQVWLSLDRAAYGGSGAFALRSLSHSTTLGLNNRKLSECGCNLATGTFYY